MKKTNYIVKIYDTIEVHSEITGTNKEVVLREAAKIARNKKTKHHWKNKITIFTSLHLKEKYETNPNNKPIITKKF